MTRKKSPAGRPKGDKRQRTKEKLVQAAAEAIAEHGYERMSLEDVARRAGMSRGAIYGNFTDKDELILAVIKRGWRPVAPALEPGTSFAELMRHTGADLARVSAERVPRVRQALAFQLYALNHDSVRRRFASLNSSVYARMAESLVRDFAGNLPLPADKLVRVLHALSDGLMMARAMNPKEFDDEVIAAAFDLFARSRPARG